MQFNLINSRVCVCAIQKSEGKASPKKNKKKVCTTTDVLGVNIRMRTWADADFS